MVQVVSGVDVLVIKIVEGSFVPESRTKVVCKFLNVPSTTVCQNLPQLKTKVLLPRVLTNDNDKVIVVVLLDHFGHGVWDIKVVDGEYGTGWDSLDLFTWNASVEKSTVSYAKISTIKYYQVKPHVEGVVK
jgi:hypothetical protein